jgi:hypothetical protein
VLFLSTGVRNYGDVFSAHPEPWFDKPLPSAVGLRRAQAERLAEGLTTSENVTVIPNTVLRKGHNRFALSNAPRGRYSPSVHDAHRGSPRAQLPWGDVYVNITI